MDNACKYSTERAVAVLIATDAQSCRVTLTDHGIGIPTDELAAIFDPFFRGANAISYPGFGLGLSICHRVINVHSGQLTVESRLNQGSTFTIVLPHLTAA